LFLDDAFSLQKNNRYDVLPVLYKEFRISFDIKPNETVNCWSNIIRIGIEGADYDKYGERNPALFFSKGTGCQQSKLISLDFFEGSEIFDKKIWDEIFFLFSLQGCQNHIH
jgi:hypothetical protein